MIEHVPDRVNPALHLIRCHLVQGLAGGPSSGSRASSQAGYAPRQAQYEEEGIPEEEEEIQVRFLHSSALLYDFQKCCGMSGIVHEAQCCEERPLTAVCAQEGNSQYWVPACSYRLCVHM